MLDRLIPPITGINMSLLERLNFRIQEQGPFVVAISDILSSWIPTAVPMYRYYAEDFYFVQKLIQNENATNPEIDQLFRSAEDKWRSWLMRPSTRIEEYVRALKSLDRSIGNTTKMTFLDLELQPTLAEMEAFASSIRSSIEHSKTKGRISDLDTALNFDLEENVDLRLNQNGRQLLAEGSLNRLERRRNDRQYLSPTYVMLFDQYLVLATCPREGEAGWVEGRETYYVNVPVSKTTYRFSMD